VRQALSAQDFSDIAPDLRVTFSAGVTMIEPDDGDAAAIERADRAMYRAKSEGRNRGALSARARLLFHSKSRPPSSEGRRAA
jgi:PleD family two-component response regulator